MSSTIWLNDTHLKNQASTRFVRKHRNLDCDAHVLTHIWQVHAWDSSIRLALSGEYEALRKLLNLAGTMVMINAAVKISLIWGSPRIFILARERVFFCYRLITQNRKVTQHIAVFWSAFFCCQVRSGGGDSNPDWRSSWSWSIGIELYNWKCAIVAMTFRILWPPSKCSSLWIWNWWRVVTDSTASHPVWMCFKANIINNYQLKKLGSDIRSW